MKPSTGRISRALASTSVLVLCASAFGQQTETTDPTKDISDHSHMGPALHEGITRHQEAVEPKGMLSLTTVAPQLLFQEKRYDKFFGDPNFDAATIDGGLFERQFLLGSFNGARTSWSKNGFLLDFGLTQVVQGVVSGDSDDDWNYVGSADIWLGLDTGRAGLWPGGQILAHAEGNWGDPVSGSGALLPLNADSIMPGEPDAFALSEFYISQAFSEEVSVIAGKADFAAFVDTNFFANNERTQFLNEGLVNNAALGAFVPYTAWGALLLAAPTEEIALGAAVIQDAGSATVSGFDDFSVDALTFAAAAIYNPTFGNLPGSYQLLLGYTTKDQPSFAIDDRYLIEEIIGIRPPVEESGNYALTFTASQYVWVDEAASAQRKGVPPVGWGPFFRFGITPDDRNVIDQFYSFGIGGKGALFPGRDDDHWGIGWAGSHISDDFRRLASGLGTEVDDFEHVIEGFYNVALTPAASLTFDVQYVDPTNPDRDDLIVIGTRLQLDF